MIRGLVRWLRDSAERAPFTRHGERRRAAQHRIANLIEQVSRA
jgi:hypothetical protein